MEMTLHFRLPDLVALALITSLILSAPAQTAVENPPQDAAAKEDARMEYQAGDMLKRGLDLLEQKQEERAIKLISSVPRLFPNARARFRACLALGKYFAGRRDFDRAIKQFQYVEESSDPDARAEALYETGICHFQAGAYDKAFMALRKVTAEFAGSVFANEAFYYIGQCHFKQGRWAKAIEALEMVGASVPESASEGAGRVEAGQRLHIKVHDRDLVVLSDMQKKLEADVITQRGDRERAGFEPLGRSGEYYIASIVTQPGEPKPGNGILEVAGGDAVTAEYTDENTEAGHANRKVLAKADVVSTAAAGFTDGAYREYADGVFADQQAFLRVADLDRNVSPQPDTLHVRLTTQYKAANTAEGEEAGPDAEEAPQWVVRRSLDVALIETAAQSGVFTAAVPLQLVQDPNAPANPGSLAVLAGDELVLHYSDEKSLAGSTPREVLRRAKVLTGQVQDVKVENRIVDSAELKARKNLIEARLNLKLGQIFKDVGLNRNASEKADDGLARVEETLSTGVKAGLDRSIIEEAFSVKWDLLLVQDKLGEAIAVCQTLTRLFPDSTLVDRALLRIGQAKVEAGIHNEAINIFNSIVNLPKSDLKAEAQYNIGAVLEKIANLRAGEIAARNKGEPRDPDLSQAMLAYKKCAESFPESPYAGESLDKIANYYIATKDYPRAIELMEQVFQDYPDAGFLDKMLLKWVIAAYRMGNYVTAREKAEKLLAEYPSSPLADKARQFLETIRKKI